MEETQNNLNQNSPKQSTLTQQIEALLFYRGEPMKISQLVKILGKGETEITNAITELTNILNDRGIRLSQNHDSVTLITAPETSEIIEKIRKEESLKDLSKAALETLSIIIYRGPIKRADIDFVRGVNSQFILRLLLIRGLIEKETNPNDERGYLYKTSHDLLNLLGIENMTQIPEYESVNRDVESFLETTAGDTEDDEDNNDNREDE